MASYIFFMKIKLLFLLNVLFLSALFGQQQFSFDENLKQVHLKNGLECYLHPLKSEQKIVFYLLVNVGSLQENPKQLGYAHFLEHMVFKGIPFFQNKTLVSFLNEKGLEIGRHFNAVTGYHKTIYQFILPEDKQILDRLFLFLKALLRGDLIFKKQDVAKEKRIILEEKRVRPPLNEDFNWKLVPKYLQRIPIGTDASIVNASPDSLKKFYKKYYNPQNVTLIITGNFDKARLQKHLTKHLAPILNRSLKIRSYSLYKNLKPKYRTQLDTTLKGTKIIWQQARKFLVPNIPKNYKKWLIEKILQRVVAHRLKTLYENTSYHFSLSRRYFLSDTDFYTLEIAASKSIKILEAIFKIYKEIATYGIPKKHLRIHLKNYMDFVKSDLTTSKQAEDWAESYLEYALKGTFPMEMLSKKKWQHDLLLEITSDDLERCAREFLGTSKNLITYKYHYKQRAIKKDSLLTLLKTWTQKKVVEKFYKKPEETTSVIKKQHLEMPKIKAQKPIEKKHFANTDITHMVYKNGAEVFIKPVKNKEKSIRLLGIAKGGTSFIPDSLYYKYAATVAYMELGGIGNLNNQQLNEFLDDKMIALSMGVTENSRRVYGYTLKKNLKAFFTYFYLKMTRANTDEKSFKEVIAQELKSLANNKNEKENPLFTYQKIKSAIEATYFPNRKAAETSAALKSLSLTQMQIFYNQAFANSMGWRYVCVGDFTLSEIQPFLDTYIGGMKASSEFPKQKKLFNVKEYPKYQRVSSKKQEKNIKMHYVFYGAFKESQAHLKLKLAIHLIRKKITETMREEYGLVYTPVVYEQIRMEPAPFYTISISYACKSENKNKLERILLKIMNNFITKKVPARCFSYAKKNKILTKKEVFKNANVYNLGFTLLELLHCGVSMQDLENFGEHLSTITEKELQLFLQNTLNLDNFRSLEYR